MRWDVERRAEELRRHGRPFVLATVVRVERPASTHPGDRALVTPDGVLDGWVGGACCEPLVVREALRALVDRTPRLLRIGPPPVESVQVVPAVTTCPSGGTLSLGEHGGHLPGARPPRPPPGGVRGGSGGPHPPPAGPHRRVPRHRHRERGAALAAPPSAVHVGHLPPEAVGPQDGVVVATMGHWDEEALAQALRTPALYVALVASWRRAAALRDELRRRGVDEIALARLRAPAGWDLGPATQEEIALAVLAEFAALRRGAQRQWSRGPGPGGGHGPRVRHDRVHPRSSAHPRARGTDLLLLLPRVSAPIRLGPGELRGAVLGASPLR